MFKSAIPVALLLFGACLVPASFAATSQGSADSDPHALLADFRRPAVVPASRSNPLTPEKVALGQMLFFDPRISGSGVISCATCHNPALGWSDALPKGLGHMGGRLGRHTPTILNVAYGELYFWDGRAATLEEQAKGPLTSAAEMNMPAADAVGRVASIPGYVTAFAYAFPGKPISVDTIAAAIASYERTVVSNSAPFGVRAAAFVHSAFYVLLVAQPVIGIFVAWARGDSVGLLGLVAVSAPFEMSDPVRERLMTAHAATAMLLFGLCLVHVGAVFFNRIVRRLSVIDRMLEPAPEDRLVNRVPIAAQLSLAFGLVIAMALLVGLNAVRTYREQSRATEAFQNGDLAVADQLRAAQVAWKDLSALAASEHADAGQIKDLEDSASSSLADAQTHAAGDVKDGLTRVIGQLAAVAQLDGTARSAAIKSIDTDLQNLVDSQSVQTLQHRTENDDKAARGHDLIVVTVLPMLLTGLIAGLFLARSITGALSLMGRMIKSIESDQRDKTIQVEGRGEIAALTLAIVSMRAAVQDRGSAAAARQAQLEADRARVTQEQLEREAELERQQSVARRVQREQLAAEFESHVAGIVGTVAQTAHALSSTAAQMAASASNSSQRSRSASAVAERTSGTSADLAAGTNELSTSAKSVRANAEQSKSRASLAVKEAAEASEQIDYLAKAAHQIRGITDLISTVARKTHLLAINARIEAARAGDVGRGFSIVADEVKALSSQTHAATHEIEKQIKELSAAAARSSGSLQRLTEVIAGVDVATNAIFAATDAQFASTRQLAERVSEISTSMGTVAQDIRGAQETAQATERMSSDVVDSAAVIDGQAGQLREKVADFVVQLRNAGTASQAPTHQTGPARDARGRQDDAALVA